MAVIELFDFIELHFHKIMDCFDVRLHAMGAGEDSAMALAG